MRRLIYFTVLSLIIHLTLRSGLFTLASITQAKAKDPMYEVVLVDQPEAEPENMAKPMIKQLETPPNELINDNSLARFDSEKTQRVRQETKARNLGLTQNASRKASSEKARSKPPEPKSDLGSQPESELPEFTRMNMSSGPTQVQAQNSAISTLLPNDIRFSDATNLNTDANTYYSFYSRVEELFYVRWSERLNYYWDRLPYDFKKRQLSGRVWSTVIEVWLTSTGEFHSAYIRRESGYKPFDEATVFAFKDARFFPNPPRAKVESDGFVRLKYRFNVHIGPLP